MFSTLSQSLTLEQTPPPKKGGGDLFETNKTGSQVDGHIFYFWLTSQPLALHVAFLGGQRGQGWPR